MKSKTSIANAPSRRENFSRQAGFMPNFDPRRSVRGVLTYHEQLKHPLWQKKSAEIKQLANWTCEDCRARDRQLTCHHTVYTNDRYLWEYDASRLMCLCMDCHSWRQSREDAFRVALGEITRFLAPDILEAEVWEILGTLRLRQTQRLAEAFS